MDWPHSLIASVHSAFPSTPRPPDEAVTFTKYWNGVQYVPIPYPDAEPFEVARFLSNKPWQALATDLKSWRDRCVCLSCLTAEGLAYYLPAYLIFVLRETQDPYWGDVLETTLFRVSPVAIIQTPNEPAQVFQSRMAKFNAFVHLLSNDQKRVIRDFLNYIRERYVDIYVFDDDIAAHIKYWEGL